VGAAQIKRLIKQAKKSTLDHLIDEIDANRRSRGKRANACSITTNVENTLTSYVETEWFRDEIRASIVVAQLTDSDV